MDEIVYLSCPECGDVVESVPPENWIVPGRTPLYRHAEDGTALCAVVGAGGYQPAEPVEHFAREVAQ